jgi:hypothetical protein
MDFSYECVQQSKQASMGVLRLISDIDRLGHFETRVFFFTSFAFFCLLFDSAKVICSLLISTASRAKGLCNTF